MIPTCVRARCEIVSLMSSTISSTMEARLPTTCCWKRLAKACESHSSWCFFWGGGRGENGGLLGEEGKEKSVCVCVCV